MLTENQSSRAADHQTLPSLKRGKVLPMRCSHFYSTLRQHRGNDKVLQELSSLLR
ncbi:hypothetical protein BT69DRAFT_1286895 [Atractiella rhizophila]|nr:hypothetical protein BT69DRAFT_1288673 [Atractiella rhizophila]KAH8917215.1 hypothetical protein BT69DRAFT_1286895 [Atractiella rhizophila]